MAGLNCKVKAAGGWGCSHTTAGRGSKNTDMAWFTGKWAGAAFKPAQAANLGAADEISEQSMRM